MNLRYFLRILSLFIFLFFGGFFVTNDVFAAVLTWDGGGATDNWSEDANWSGDTEPGVFDTAVFDGGISSDNVVVDVAIEVSGITIESDYAGTITQAASVTVGGTGFSMAGGVYDGVSYTTRYNGDFLLSGGSYTATTGDFEFYTNLTWTGGTLDATGSTFEIYGCAGNSTLTYAGDFNTATNADAFVVTKFCAGDFTVASGTTLEMQASTSGADIYIQSGATVVVDGNFSSSYLENNGSFTVTGTSYQSSWSSVFDGVLNDLSAVTTFVSQKDLTIGTGDTLTLGDTDIVLYGYYTNNGTFNISGKTLRFGGCAVAQGITYSGNFSDDTGALVVIESICGSDFTVSTGQNIEISSIINGGVDLIIESGATATVTGSAALNYLSNLGSFSVEGSTYSSALDSVFDGSVNDLSLVTSFQVGRDLTVGTGDTLTVGASTLYVGGIYTNNGTFDISGKTLTFNGCTGTAYIVHTGNFNTDTGVGSVLMNKICNGTFIVPSGQILTAGSTSGGTWVQVNAGGTLTLTGNISLSILDNLGSLTIDGGSFYAYGAVDLDGTVNDFTDATSITVNGTFTIDGSGLTVSSVPVTINGSALTVNAPITMIGGGLLQVTITGLTFINTTITDTTLLNHPISLTINDSVDSVVFGSDFSISGDFIREDGIVTNPASPYTFSVGGDVFFDGTDSFGGNNLNLNLSHDSADQEVYTQGSPLVMDFEINKLAGSVILQESFYTTGDCDLTDGSFELNGYSFICDAGFGVNSGGNLILRGDEILTEPTLNTGSLVTYVGDGDSLADVFAYRDFLYDALTFNPTDSADSFEPTGVDPLTRGLVAYYDFEDGTGSVLSDGTGNGYDGSLQNMESGDWSSDVPAVGFTNNFSLDFDGADEYIDLGNPSLFPAGTDPRTMCTWAKTDTVAGGYRLAVAYGTPSNSQAFFIAQNGDVLYVGTYGNDLTYSSAWSVGVWTHVCAVYSDDGELTAYVNGEAVVNDDKTINTVRSVANIGRQINGFEYWDGKLDEVRFYDRALSDAEIKALSDGQDYALSTVTELSVANDLTLVDGGLVLPTGTSVFSGDLINTAGTVDPNGGSVDLGNVSQEIVGEWFFEDLIKTVIAASTLIFPQSDIVTILGDLTLQGAAGQLLTLISSNDGMQAQIDPQGSRTLSYLDVQDSNNIDSTVMNCGVTCVDSGNNTNWAFAPGISVSAISGNTSENETTATFTVVLDVPPTDDVTISVTSNDLSEGTVDESSLLFTTLNWDTPQVVTVTGEDDAIVDGDIDFDVVLGAAVSDDTGYNGIDPTDVAVTNEDNDVAGITVSAISGNTTEAGGAETFSVVLDSQPTGSVSINLASSDSTEGMVSTGTLVFTTGNWDDVQIVTVTGQDDFVDDGNVAYSVILAAAVSTDGAYDGLNPADVAITNTDDDTAGISVSAISGNTTEAGATATFSVVLDSEPTATVIIGVSSSDTTEGTVSTSLLTFTTGNWDDAQIVTVTGQDDFVDDGDILYSIILAEAGSTDPLYDVINPSDVSVTNLDGDVAGFVVSAISGNTTEAGGTATFTVFLSAEPADDVTLPVASSDSSEGLSDVTELVFTSGDWDDPQLVTITGQDDILDDGNVVYSIVLGVAISSDVAYSGLNPSDVSVTNEDDDNIGVSYADLSGNTEEDGTQATFTVVLLSEPSDNVTVPISTSDASEGIADVTELVFTDLNWSTPQMVTVTGQDDDLNDGDIFYSIVLGVTDSLDPQYDDLNPADVSLQNIDDENAGFSVSAISGNTSEAGSTASFTVVLTSEPSDDVTIPVASSDTSEGTLGVVDLEFSSLNWDTPQTVIVTGVDDFIDDGTVAYSIVLSAASSSDPDYQDLNPSDVSVNNTDNDISGFSVSAISGDTDEDGEQAVFSVVLTSQPTAVVTIDVSSNDVTEGVVSISELVFTDLNWSTAQDVTVTGVDDDVVDGNIAYSIILAAAESLDLSYDTLDPEDRPLENLDNDTLGILINESSGSTDVSEVGSTSDSFTLVLNSEPTADVVVTLAYNDEQVTVSPDVLTFTDLNWSTPQTVTVTAVDDSVDETSPHTELISSTVDSLDGGYDGYLLSNIDVLITDNDVSDVTVGAPTPTAHTTEAGGELTFTVALTTQPSADVSMSVSSSDTGEGAVSSSPTLTFTDLNWSTPQTVTVTGQDDDRDDGDASYDIDIGPLSSVDSLYNGQVVASVSLVNDDDDTSGINLTESDGSTDISEEGATSDTYEIVLESEPFNAVTIELVYDDEEVTVSDNELVFTALNWGTPQIVTVTALDDAADEAADNLVPYETVINHTVVSDDLAYDGVALSSVSVAVLDNDEAVIDSSTSRGSSQSFVSNATVQILGVNGAECADRSQVVLRLTAVDADSVLVSNNSEFDLAHWQPFVADDLNELSAGNIKVMTIPWTLGGDEGEQVVYVRFRSSSANMTGTYVAVVQLGLCEVGLAEDDLDDGDIIVEGEPSVDACIPGAFGVSPFDGSNEEITCLDDGALIRGEHYSTIYRIENGIRRPFLNEAVYFTWSTSFNDVKVVSDATLSFYPLGEPILPNPTTILVKSQSNPTVYVTEYKNGQSLIRPILNEEDAKAVYGSEWQQFVIDLPDSVFSRYIIGSAFNPEEATGTLLFARIGLQAFDSDRDGLSDRAETLLGTDRYYSDTDKDGYLDGIEILNGYSPLVPSSGARIDLKSIDSDGDSLTDFIELMLGTDPMDTDSDNDGYPDGLEVATNHDPLAAP